MKTNTASKIQTTPDPPKPKTFFWTKWGISFAWQKKGGILHIHDINPEWRTQYRLTRWECVKVAWGFIRAAFISRA